MSRRALDAHRLSVFFSFRSFLSFSRFFYSFFSISIFDSILSSLSSHSYSHSPSFFFDVLLSDNLRGGGAVWHQSSLFHHPHGHMARTLKVRNAFERRRHRETFIADKQVYDQLPRQHPRSSSFRNRRQRRNAIIRVSAILCVVCVKCLFCLSVCLFVCLSVCQSVCP